MSPDHVFLLASAAIVLGAVALLGWYSDPAWPLSIGIGLSIFSSNWQYIGLHALPLDRLALVLGVVTLAARAPRARDRPRFRIEPVHWLLVAVSAYAVVSALLAGTLSPSAGGFRLVDRLSVEAFIVFFVAPVAFRTERQRSILLGTLVFVGGYLGLITLFQTINANSLIFPRYILNPQLGIHVGLGRGPFLEAEANGTALFMCAVAAAIAVKVWKGALARAAAGCVAILCLTGCMFSLERAVWIGAAAAILVCLAFGDLRRAALPVGLVLVIALGGAALLVPGLAARITVRSQEKLSVIDRQNLNAAAVRMVEAKPLFGFGWARFQTDSLPYFRQGPDIPLRAPASATIVHSIPLSNAVELGLVGATLWAAGLLLALWGSLLPAAPESVRLWQMGLAPVAVMWLIVANLTPLAQVFPSLLLWTWMGVARARPRAREVQPVPALRPSWLARPAQV